MKTKDAEPLTAEQAEQLYEHIRAIESLEADKKDIQEDIAGRKTLVTESLPVQKDVLDFVLKRRKHSSGTIHNFDTMLELVEEAIEKVESKHSDEVRVRIAEGARRGAAAQDAEDEDEEEEPELSDVDPF